MTIKSQLFQRSPQWRLNRQGLQLSMPVEVKSWVYERGSLTQRLRAIYGSELKVTVLMQQWTKPFLAERMLLNLPEYQYCLTREVILHAYEQPLILARTIIPKHTVKLAHTNLAHLGNRPLGEVIFNCPNLLRQALAITTVIPGTWTTPIRTLAEINQGIWGRSTVYQVEHKPMLVNEFFLPSVL